mmetsp:Transcript_138839/g.443240  ORF Transcript_138839/g.443240 Transcript_138839/m.443240 type:complete len:623 (+) Transcript_138839:33-1901(+)
MCRGPMRSLSPAAQLDRTPSNHSRYITEGVWCFEREFDGQERCPPVRLIVFDWDETLTLSTFLPEDRGLRQRIGWCEWADYITEHNFQTPLVDGTATRVEKLRALFKDLAQDEVTGSRRFLAVLTRNNQGSIACLNLLLMAGLDEHFSAVWCMRPAPGRPNSVYRKPDGTWSAFNSPLDKVFDHKADVLHAMCKDPAAWFPQLAEGDENAASVLRGLRPEGIVLVDDVRTNFQSSAPDKAKVLRYCKVARYDCVYREHGFKRDMGGIGAKDDSDYAILLDFVRQPWEYKALLKARCVERQFEGADDRPRVDLVVFDFDETLTLHTWMPSDRRCVTEIGFRLPEEKREHFVTYNFSSPYVSDDRVERLGVMLKELAVGEDDADGRPVPRTLAILTRNEDGAVAVLNLLAMAGLDAHFSAIWALGSDAEAGAASGVYRQGSEWRAFELPGRSVDLEPTKVNVLRCVVENPQAWFPQLASDAGAAELAHIAGMPSLASIVLVDDEPANFRGEEGDDANVIVRQCEVTRYDDDNFRDQGLITHMGGLGAKTSEDYDELLAFVRRPWLCSEQPAGDAFFRELASTPSGVSEVALLRRHTEDELECESCSPMVSRKSRKALDFPDAES